MNPLEPTIHIHLRWNWSGPWRRNSEATLLCYCLFITHIHSFDNVSFNSGPISLHLKLSKLPLVGNLYRKYGAAHAHTHREETWWCNRKHVFSQSPLQTQRPRFLLLCTFILSRIRSPPVTNFKQLLAHVSRWFWHLLAVNGRVLRVQLQKTLLNNWLLNCKSLWRAIKLRYWTIAPQLNFPQMQENTFQWDVWKSLTKRARNCSKNTFYV